MAADDATVAPTQPGTDFDLHVTGLAALGDPLRRALYRFVISQAGAVSRDQAAKGAGVARHVAKFHLDKLAEDGLLVADYARPPGRGGPGAGRPAKLYRRSSRELTVSVPQREYALAGRLLAQAVTDAERNGVTVGDALGTAARSTGRTLGDQACQHAGSRPSRATLVAAATSVLGAWGYEPRSDESGITLANCPFHALAEEYTDLVCGMNLELMVGLVSGLGAPDLEARLEPSSGLCCVRLGLSNNQRTAMRSTRRK